MSLAPVSPLMVQWPDAAEYLSVSRHTLRKWVYPSSGTTSPPPGFPNSIKVGKRRYFVIKDLEEYMLRLSNKANPHPSESTAAPAPITARRPPGRPRKTAPVRY